MKRPEGSSSTARLGEGCLHGSLVSLAGADDPAVRPHRNPPLPILDHLRVGLIDESPDAGERFAPPGAQLFDFRIDQLGGRGFLFSILWDALLHG